MSLVLEEEEGAPRQVKWVPGKGKETDFYSESPEGNADLPTP
jgi:hypothetical protein